MSFRIDELDAQFADLQVKEQQWPLPGPNIMPMYKKYLTHTYKLGQNIVCACCGCISHDIMEFEVVLPSYDPLHHLRVPENVNIPFNFSCGIDVLDQNHVLIDKLGITQDKHILLCHVLQEPSALRSTGKFPMSQTCSRSTPRFDLDRGTPDHSGPCLWQYCSSRPTKQPIFIFWHQRTCCISSSRHYSSNWPSSTVTGLSLRYCQSCMDWEI